ncbi:LADA_0F15302g1_1 [Lachancea dasiensis]|uniref:LADA_0F15302g1_1 n=1 Tax=Lachancea dasiensis TaxID=1072105 RepID=A0A1G4JNG6_9SACH|nr:LADA_0F15302g1_1 [Lachancea dasiensis]
MSSTANQKPTRFWSKVKSSTKSISSSLSQLSIKQERDGDTPTTTVVHKALVKFYTHREPFEGFPDWLGHKEELPDEQKVLRKQKHHHHDPRAGIATVTPNALDKSDRPAVAPHATAGSNFRDIYRSSTSSASSRTAPSSSPGAAPVPQQSLGSQESHPTLSNQRTSSMLMRERLKRK